jgi:hypothetical protein
MQKSAALRTALPCFELDWLLTVLFPVNALWTYSLRAYLKKREDHAATLEKFHDLFRDMNKCTSTLKLTRNK